MKLRDWLLVVFSGPDANIFVWMLTGREIVDDILFYEYISKLVDTTFILEI